MNGDPSVLIAFMDRALLEILRESPETAAMLGVDDHPALSEGRARFMDHSLAGIERRKALVSRLGAEFDALVEAGVPDDVHLSVAVFDAFLKYIGFDHWVGREGLRFAHHDHPVRHKDGAHIECLTVLGNLHALETADDVDCFLSRVEALPGLIADLDAGTRWRDAHENRLPDFALAILCRELDALFAVRPVDSQFYGDFSRRLNGVPGLSQSVRAAHRERVVDALRDRIYPTYHALRETLRDVMTRADDTPGVWRLKDGEAWYAYLLRTHTTTGLDAETIHAFGRDEAGRLRARIRERLRAVGADADAPARAFAAREREDADKSTDARRRREELPKRFEAILGRTEAGLGHAFNRLPTVRCRIVPCPPHLEARRTSNYTPPAAGGRRPGLFELNAGMEAARPAWELPILAWHEVWPGHHLQLALQQELGHLPFFRRVLVFTAYIEGWAKYAEALPVEAGLETDPWVELAQLRRELYSTVNLALDTGIHHKRFTRAEAVRFFCEEAFADRALAEYVVDRIAVTPAQTTAYKLGLVRFRELHELVCGDSDRALAAFHDMVLLEGSLPLDVLERSVRDRLSGARAR